MNKFYVLNYTYDHKVEYYDVLPYFRQEWKVDNILYDDNWNRMDVDSKELFKQWIEKKSKYHFWARCEYEFLMANWPFGSKKMFDKLKPMIGNINLDDYRQRIDLCNAVICDMYKIDIHEQIMMNIDVIADILANEFNLK